MAKVASTSNGGIHGVVYLGHIPHSFYEADVQKYFCQFGEIKKCRLSRSKKTGNCKGYGYLQFESDDIAQIVAGAMNNYLMFKKKLICKHIPADEVHPRVFKGAQRKFSEPKAHLLALERHNRVLSKGKEKAASKRLQYKTEKRLEKLAQIGVTYSLPSHGLNSVAENSAKNTSFF